MNLTLFAQAPAQKEGRQSKHEKVAVPAKEKVEVKTKDAEKVKADKTKAAENGEGATVHPRIVPIEEKKEAAKETPKPKEPGVAEFQVFPGPNGKNLLMLNFRDATYRQIFEAFTKAGVQIVEEKQVADKRATVISTKRLTIDEALNLLNSALIAEQANAYRDGDIIKVIDLAKAKERYIPVRVGNNPDEIEEGGQVVTQIIPLKAADAAQISEDLKNLIPSYADLSVNQHSNALVYTDTNSNIKRFMTIIKELDNTVLAVSDIKIFTLENANASEIATVIRDLFETEQPGRSSRSNDPRRRFFEMMRMRFSSRFGGRGRFSPFGRGGASSRRGGPSSGLQPGMGSAARQEVKVAVEERSNSLIVVASEENLKLIEEIVEELDSNTSQSESTLVYTCKYADPSELSNVLNDLFIDRSQGSRRSPFGFRGFSSYRRSSRSTTRRSSQSSRISRSRGSGRGAYRGGRQAVPEGMVKPIQGDVYIVPEQDSNSIVIVTNPRNFDSIMQVLEQLDVQPPQVLIQALFAEITLDDSVNWDPSYSIFEFSDLIQQLNVTAVTNIAAQGDPGFVNAFRGQGNFDLNSQVTLGVTNRSFDLFIRDLQTQGRANILSRPQVLVSNNQEARISISADTPFVETTRQTAQGEPISEIDYREVGIILEVTPHINPDGVVLMSVHPEISSISDTTVLITRDQEASVFPTREADTTVAIKDGQTIVIGGLITDEDQETVRKVPILGDIPLIGWAFKSVDRTKQKKELLIFITPRVIRDSDQLEDISQREKSLTSVNENFPDYLELMGEKKVKVGSFSEPILKGSLDSDSKD